MQNSSRSAAFVLGGLISLGLVFLGYFIGSAAIEVKEYERTVKVKGLSEREYPADIVIWPIVFSVAANNLDELYATVERNNARIKEFLMAQGLEESAVTIALPAITDKSAQQYGGAAPAPFRYTARQTVTVYTEALEKARSAMSALSVLGKKGIVFEGDGYGNQTEYLFTRLNEIKPEMIEEATRKAREVALKFAEDSQSSLGKIKRASQGQFSISARDTNNPHVKRIRVVSTVEYYLSD